MSDSITNNDPNSGEEQKPLTVRDLVGIFLEKHGLLMDKEIQRECESAVTEAQKIINA